MLGNRFSFTASAFVFATACSAIISGPTASAQQYQQTNFPQYGSTSLPKLSTQATRAPVFSDTQNNATAMSPDTWGESAIRNPYAGYQPQRYQAQSATIQQTAFQQNSAPAQSVRTIGNSGGFAPGSINADALAKAASTAKDALAGADDLKSIMEPLTNTQNSHTAQTVSAGSESAKPAYPANRYAQLLDVPGLPNLKQAPSFPFESNSETGSFDQLPAMKTTPSPTKSPVEFNSPDSMLDTNRSVPQTSGFGSPNTMPATQTVPPTQTVFPAQTVTPTFVQQTAPVTPMTATTGRSLHSGYPLGSNSPVQNQVQNQIAPVQQQAAPYIGQSPLYAEQASGPISNQWGYGYPESGIPNQPHVETPFQISNHGNQVWQQPSNIGQRSAQPTVRNTSILDQGEKFDNENKKKEFPPFGEIIATGRFFGSAEVAFLRPHFLGNTGVSLDGPEFSESIPFTFDNETAPHLRFGFESKYGPGFEFNYFNINANSENIAAAFNGVASANTIASITGPDRFTQLSANDFGEVLNVNHSFELETYSVNAFKEIQFPISRINGQFGFTYANIAQSLEATVNDGGGNVLDSLNSTSDFRGFGPKFGLEYYRPVGHTPLELVTSFHGTGLFGRRDQFVENSTELVQRRFGADEFVTVFDFMTGLQFKKTIAENRSWFARVAFVHQSWLGGGTAVDPQGDFGLKGFTFGVGYNR